MMLAAVIALKAYSEDSRFSDLVRMMQELRDGLTATKLLAYPGKRTDLVEPSIVGEDGDVSVVAACSEKTD